MSQGLIRQRNYIYVTQIQMRGMFFIWSSKTCKTIPDLLAEDIILLYSHMYLLCTYIMIYMRYACFNYFGSVCVLTSYTLFNASLILSVVILFLPCMRTCGKQESSEAEDAADCEAISSRVPLTIAHSSSYLKTILRIELTFSIKRRKN